MRPPSVEFITSFHSLPGELPGEQRKQLYLLLNKTRQNVGNEIDLSSLKPKNQLEEIFKTEALIYFKKTKELFELLKDDNPIVINRVLKSGAWFIKEAFKDISGEQLATEIFPAISFNTKEKLLTRLAVYIDDLIKADEYIEAVEKNYSLYLAQRLLPACSSETILRYISKRTIEVTPGQLLTIIKKYPEHTEHVFRNLSSYYTKQVQFAEKYRSVFLHLARNDAPKLLKLLDENKLIFMNFGRRSAAKFISRTKRDMIERPCKFQGLLDFKHVGRCLEEKDFRRFYEAFFPKSIQRVKLNMRELLDSTKHMKSKPAQLKLLVETFKKIHGNDLWDYSDLVTQELIEMMSPEERHAWIEVHQKPDYVPQETWVSYMKLEQSVPLLKNKILLSSKDTTRKTLIRALVGTCKLNENIDELMTVLEYLMKNHRNDRDQVVDDIFATLSESFDLTKFNDSQWEVVLNFLQTIKGMRGSSYWLSQVDEKYLQYRCEKELPITEELNQWLKNNPSTNYGICFKNPLHQKRYLIEICTVPYWDETSDNQKISYLNAVAEWNKKHRNHRISFFLNPKNIEVLRKLLQENDTSCYETDYVAFSCIVSEFQRCQEIGLFNALSAYESPGYCYTKRVLQWMVKNKPHVLYDHKALLVDVILGGSGLHKRDRYLKIWTEIAEELTKMLRENHRKVKEKHEIQRVVVFLTWVMQPKQVLRIVSSYYPTKPSPDFESDDGQRIYWMQEAFLWNIKNVMGACATLEPLLKFCRGDYLKLSVVSLYCTAHRVPECKLGSFLDVLTKRAVSVRKHALSIGFRALQIERATKLLHQFMSSENNVSIRKTLFKMSLKCFLQKPNELTWNLTKDNLEKVDKDDGEAFEFLTTSGNMVERSYFMEYFTYVWAMLKTLPASNKMSLEGKSKVLETIQPDVVSELPEDFRKEIVEMLVSEPASNASTAESVVKCIVYLKPETEQKKQMDMTISHIKNFTETKTLFNKQFIYDLIKRLCWQYLREKTKAANKILRTFLKLWSEALQPHQVIDEYLYMEFTSIYLKIAEEKLNITDVARQVAIVCDDLYNKGRFVLNVFKDILADFFVYFFRNDPEGDCTENRIIFTEGILQNGRSAGALLLAVSLLPSHIENKIFKSRYEKLIRVIAESDDSTVRIYLSHYFSDKDWCFT